MKQTPRKPPAPRRLALPRVAAPLPACPPLPLPAVVVAGLAAVRARHRLAAVLNGGAWAVGALVAIAAVQWTLDYLVILPRAARAALLVLDAVLIVFVLWRCVGRPWQMSPDEVRAAVLAERRWPHLRSRLVSAVRFARAGPGTMRGSDALAVRVIAEAAREAERLQLASIVDMRPVRMAWLASCAALGASILFALATWPRPVPLFQRWLLWEVPVPRETIVTDLTGDLVVAAGSDVVLAARADGRVPESALLTLRGDGQPREILMRPERDRPGVFAQTVRQVSTSFTWRIDANDGTTGVRSVKVVPRPALAALRLRQVFPGYTERAPEPLDTFSPKVLAGSVLEIDAEATSRLRGASVFLAGLNVSERARVSGRAISASVRVPASGLEGFTLRLEDREGIEGESALYRLDIEPDRVPIVEVEWPGEQENLVAVGARPELRIRATDDFAVAAARFHYRAVLPTSGPERSLPLSMEGSKTEIHVAQPWDPATAEPAGVPGVVYEVWYEVEDNNVASGPGVARTGRVTVRILTPEQKRAALLQRLVEAVQAIEGARRRQVEAGEALREAVRRPVSVQATP